MIALDRMERGNGKLSAIQEVYETHGIQVASIVNLDDIVKYLRNDPDLACNLPALETYRARYGAK
jgi:orotate phosphoribosyltransferase